MHLTITGRNMDVTAPLKDYAQEKVAKMEKYLSKITSVHIILAVEKYRHIAEVTVQVHGLTLRGLEETADMYSSIDKVMDKIEIQARKLNDRIKGKNKGPSSEEMAVEAPETGPRDIQPRIVRAADFDPKPMTDEEASMQLQLRENDHFLVFLNARSNKINVIYRRKDGNFGLIETP